MCVCVCVCNIESAIVCQHTTNGLVFVIETDHVLF